MATRKSDSLAQKLLIVQPVDTAGEFRSEKDYLAIDPGYGAGVSDVVLVAREGAVVGQLLDRTDVPANVVILGVVDDWSETGQTG